MVYADDKPIMIMIEVGLYQERMINLPYVS